MKEEEAQRQQRDLEQSLGRARQSSGIRPWPSEEERLERQARLDAEMERNQAQLRADERQVRYVAVGLLVSAGLLGAAGWWLLS